VVNNRAAVVQKKDDQRRQQPNQKAGQGEVGGDIAPVAPEYRESDQGGGSEGDGGSEGGAHTVPDPHTRGV
jgi:hypothetical protein